MVEAVSANLGVNPTQKKPEMDEIQKKRAEFKKQQADAMKMMLATLKNPDPTDSSAGLKPQDMLQMTSYMMGIENQINQAEDNYKMRVTLENFMKGQDQHLVGKHVRAESEKVFVDKNGGLLTYEIKDDDIFETELKIFDETGKLILTIDGENDKGVHRLHWDGKDKDGAQVAPGTYSLLATGKGLDARTRFLTTYAYPRVQELETENGQHALILQYPDRTLEYQPYDNSKDRLSIAAPQIAVTA